MTSPQETFTKSSGFIQHSRKRWFGYALALSLALHIGAALTFIIAGGFRMAGEKTANFIIQDIDLSPSISAPVKKPAPVPPYPQPAITSATPELVQETEKSTKEPPSEQQSKPTDNLEEVGGFMSTPLGLGMTHGYFSGLADGRSLQDNIRGYYFEIVEKINREWWNKAGLLKEPLKQDVFFEVLIQRDGTVVSIRIMRGSGSREADRLLMEIIKNASPLPPLPSTYRMDLFQAPIRVKAPSFLFRLGT